MLAPKSAITWLALPVVAGIALHSYEFSIASRPGSGSSALWILAWSLLPFTVALVLSQLRVGPARAAGYAWASLLGSAYMHFSVFVIPTGSTAALGLIFMPLWNLLLLGPLGLLVVWGLNASTSGSGSNAA
jgi:hypothetical protein